MALPGQSYYNLVEARRYLLDQTGHEVIEPLLIDWIGQGLVTASVQVTNLWLSDKGAYQHGCLEREHKYDGIVNVKINESQAQRMKVDPYAVVGTETVSVHGRLWQTDFQSMGHGYPLKFDATCLLIRADDLARLAGDLKATPAPGGGKPAKPPAANDREDAKQANEVLLQECMKWRAEDQKRTVKQFMEMKSGEMGCGVDNVKRRLQAARDERKKGACLPSMQDQILGFAKK